MSDSVIKIPDYSFLKDVIIEEPTEEEKTKREELAKMVKELDEEYERSKIGIEDRASWYAALS